MTAFWRIAAAGAPFRWSRDRSTDTPRKVNDSFLRTEGACTRLTTELQRAVRCLRNTAVFRCLWWTRREHGCSPINRGRQRRSGVLPGVVITRGRGLGGKVIARGRPVGVSNYHHASTITHHYDVPVHQEGLQAVLAVQCSCGRPYEHS